MKKTCSKFRRYCQLKGGVFPDTLDLQAAWEIFEKHLSKSALKEEQNKVEQQMQEALNEARKLMHGFGSPSGNSTALRGQRRALRCGEYADFLVPAERCREIRVIYADLSVAETEMPPDVPNSQAISAKANPDK